jgi:hypothetical protein
MELRDCIRSIRALLRSDATTAEQMEWALDALGKGLAGRPAAE